jgi:hypothetical protein
MHGEVERMDTRARPRPCVSERPQGVGCRPWLERRAHALGRRRWVSHPGLCRVIMSVPGRKRRRRGRAGRWRRVGFGLLALLLLSGGLGTQPTRPVVYVVPITGMIDLGLAPFVQRVLSEAGEARGRRAEDDT